jgi:salicylate hydroxylase
MRPDRPVLIAGGGIGGLAAAIALSHHGIATHILERRSAFSEDGAGIQLSPNAVRVLERLGIAEHLSATVAIPDAIVVRDGASGRILHRLPLGDWIRQRHGAPYWLAHRRDLQAALLTVARAQPLIRFSMDFEAVAYDDANAASLRITSVSRQTVEGAALVGADGVFSRVRQQLCGSRNPTFSGLTAARTVVAAREWPSTLDTSSVGVWLAPGAHVVHYPVRGSRDIAVDIAVVVIAPATTDAHGWALPVSPTDVLASISGFAPALRDGLEPATDWRRWSLYELDDVAHWSRGRVTLLGDAAHPTLPFFAQGGALALEDAVVLAGQIARASDMTSAFAAYEKARRSRTRAIVATGRRNGRIFHLGGLAAVARDLALRSVPPERVMARYDWVYGWRA